MGMGGVIGQALLGGLQGAGNAAAYMGKSQYDSEMAAKQAEADQQRKKDLMALQDELAGARYEKNAKFDTGEGLNRMNRDQQFKVDNNNANIAMDVANNSARAAGSAADTVANQPALTGAELAKGTALQPLRMAEIDAQGRNAQAVANITVGPHNMMAQMAQSKENRVNEANSRLTDAMNAYEDASTPEQKKAAQKDLSRAQQFFAVVNGKSPGNMGGGSESGELLKQAAELDKQIKDTRESALMLQGDERKAAMKAVDGMVQQRGKIMAEAMGTGQSSQAFDPSKYDGSGSKSVPAKDPNIKGNPLGSPPASAPQPSTNVISQAIGAKPAEAPADLQAIKSDLDKEFIKLKQLETAQSGAVPRSQLSANNAARSAQQQIVEDLKVKLNMASQKFGSYPFGRY